MHELCSMNFQYLPKFEINTLTCYKGGKTKNKNDSIVYIEQPLLSACLGEKTEASEIHKVKHGTWEIVPEKFQTGFESTCEPKRQCENEDLKHTIVGCALYQFPRVTVTKYKLGGFKQQKFIPSQFWGLEAQNQHSAEPCSF